MWAGNALKYTEFFTVDAQLKAAIQKSFIFSTSEHPSTQSMARILIVEDDPMVRQLLTLNLTYAGHVTQEVNDGEQALVALHNHDVDLVLLDHMMPNCDGLSVLSSMRGNKLTAKLPVIMLSAFSSKRDQETAKHCGADDYVVKPFGAADLADRIRALLPVAH